MSSTGAATYAAKYDGKYWTGDVIASQASFDTNTGAPTLNAQWSFANTLMTQADLASRLGVKPGYISRVLRGHENLTLKTLAKIAFILDKRWECMLVAQSDHIALFSCYASSSPDSDIKTIHRAETTTIPIAGNEESDAGMSEYGEEKRYA